jgi:hypothetical protein
MALLNKHTELAVKKGGGSFLLLGGSKMHFFTGTFCRNMKKVKISTVKQKTNLPLLAFS